ncbi:ubiquitin-like protein 4A [Orussus abietinus]|uniref:ubiquitin-like protein 4A n=1 Tax=Orussus abietinus TaxID=222816 RepID=UPI0006252E02|nr:ubiquitin-like protein 4A [Orussus abietinus]
MQVTVKILQGSECVVDITPSETILELKNKVSNLLSIDANQQKLLFMGKALADENPLSFYPGIKDGSKLNLVVKKKATITSENKSTDASGIQLFRKEMSKVLSYYYTESETELIVNEVVKDLKNKVSSLSFDDLERLAAALLQDHENIA